MRGVAITNKEKNVAILMIDTKDRVERRKIKRIAIEYAKDNVRMYVDEEDEETIILIAYSLDRDKKIDVDKLISDIQRELSEMEVKEYEI